MISRDEYNEAPVVPATKNIWFLNGDLVRPHSLNRANGIVSLRNVNTGQIESCLLTDFKKNRERAFGVTQTAKLINRHVKYIPLLINKGIIMPSTPATIGKVRQWQKRAYFSESQIYEIRDILATYTIGRPRHDGLVVNNFTPTRQELTRRMGTGILTYTRTDDGRFIPIWNETL